MNRTFTQPGSPGMGAPAAAGAAKGGFFNRPGMGMLGGLAAGFLGAGLLGMLFGGGMFSGLGGLSSIIGLLLQIGLIIIVVRLAMSWWQRRHTPASAYATGPAPAADGPGAQTSFRSGLSGFGLGSSSAPLEIQPADYEAFERLLGEVQAAWSNEDVAKLHTLATPEMVSYFSKDLEENKANNDVNKVTDVKLLQGDLAEAWREGETDYRQRGDAVLAGRQDHGAHHRPSGLGQRTRRSKPPKCGPSPAGAAPIGNSRRSSRPADRHCMTRKALRFVPRRLFLCGDGCSSSRFTAPE